MLTVFTWVVEIGMNFSMTTEISSKTNVDEIISKIKNEPPISFLFVYSKDEVVTTECSPECEEKMETCYSKSGVKIPVVSHLTSHIYNFTNVPELFYFNIEQEINLTLLFSSVYSNIMNMIKTCDPDSNKIVDFYPLIKGTYVVSMGKIPKIFSKTNRIVSIIFGVGVYYELYTKSIPLINFKQNSIIDANISVNYDNIFNMNKCNEFGKCDIDNSKPIP